MLGSFGPVVPFCLLEHGIAFRSSFVSHLNYAHLLRRSLVFALEHFSYYSLFENLSLDELQPWVGVQDSFGHFRPPKLVLTVDIWLLSSILLFCYISVMVVDSAATFFLFYCCY